MRCNRPCEVYSRVVGYMRPVHLWNKGKRDEFNARKNFSITKITRNLSQKQREPDNDTKTDNLH